MVLVVNPNKINPMVTESMATEMYKLFFPAFGSGFRFENKRLAR